MTASMRDAFRKEREHLISRFQARQIRNKVNEARNSPSDAGRRWPFELLQNALDAGPRDGNSTVSVSLVCDNGAVVFEHDGAPFSVKELTALLSGGSSKEFESEEHTGRFGAGFLVTHVLAEQTLLRGLAFHGDGYEVFDLTLDRRGDEKSILQNIQRCEQKLQSAQRVTSLKSKPSARFKYVVDGNETLRLGIAEFQRALAYLYSTRPALGVVRLQDVEGRNITWKPSAATKRDLGNGVVQEREITVEAANGSHTAEYRSLRFTSREESRSSAIVVLRRQGDQWAVCIPQADFPRVFREYPIRDSGFLPTNFVLDGKFDVSQERAKLLMTDDNKSLLADALRAAVTAVQFSVGEDWVGRHRLARFDPPQSSFTDTHEEQSWWNERFGETARELATMELVETRKGLAMSVQNGEWCADFVSPKLSNASSADETTLDRLWPLIDEANSLNPPIFKLAADWSETAKAWADLGVEVNLVTVESLAGYVRKDARTLDELAVRVAPTNWLARFIDVVGECWATHKGSDPQVLNGLLPNQNGVLRSAEDLRRDDGISEQLKDVSQTLGMDVRAKLLDREILDVEGARTFKYLIEAIKTAIPDAFSEDQIIDSCIKRLDESVEDGLKVTDEKREVLHGSILLLSYLWDTKGKDAAILARKVPLVSLDGKIVRWGRERVLMAPVSNWHEDARPFVDAYPPSRVLAPFYSGNEAQNFPNIVNALIEWGIAIADPLTRHTPAELKDARLAALAKDRAKTEGVVVSNKEFTQISLLQPDILNRVRESDEAARALLGLTLCYIAPKDPSWHAFRDVRGRKAREDVDVSLLGALWLADLKYRAWVPCPGEEGESSKVVASAATLKNLLNPSWLVENDPAISLLSECFGFDSLDLRLLGATPDESKRQELRDGLARLVEIAGAETDVYESIAQDLLEKERRSRDIQRCGKFGRAVQAAIRTSLEARGLHVELVDKGFDYAVGLDEPNDLNDLSMWIEVGAHLLEIKATTDGAPRLTPTQAAKAAAESERYSLCVVDLREVPPDRLDGDWRAADVEPVANLLSNIGVIIKDTCRLVEKARSSPVGIRNEGALRYEVPVAIWEKGCSISDWVAATFRP